MPTEGFFEGVDLLCESILNLGVGHSWVNTEKNSDYREYKEKPFAISDDIHFFPIQQNPHYQKM